MVNVVLERRRAAVQNLEIKVQPEVVLAVPEQKETIVGRIGRFVEARVKLSRDDCLLVRFLGEGDEACNLEVVITFHLEERKGHGSGTGTPVGWGGLVFWVIFAQ